MAGEKSLSGVVIQGAGVAASCCAHLLAASGLSVAVSPAARPAPAVMLSDAALALLRDTFARPDLLAGRRRIERRIVTWGGAEPVALPHGGIVLSEGELLAALDAPPAAHRGNEGEQFTVHVTPPFPVGELRTFGTRPARAARVRLLFPEDESACWVEAVEDGWLFMLPTGPGQGWLLAVGMPLESFAQGSRHLARRVELMDGPVAQFESAPRILMQLCGDDWLACGSSAIGFDPICGDGTAQAAREAILAAGVITAIAEGGAREDLLQHYESMLLAAMRRHLRLCAQFYASGGRSEWWRGQQAALAEGFDWCTQRLAFMPEPRYRLEGFRLLPLELAA